MINPVDEYRKKIFRKIGLEIFNNQTILDVGCGDGADLLYLADKVKMAVGIDILTNSQWVEHRSDCLQFSVADSENLPFRKESFDVVFEKDMLHHTGNPIRALEEIKRITKKGGSIVILEANRYNPIFYFHMTLLHKHEHFTQKFFRQIVNEVFGKTAVFSSFESHVYPTNSYALIRAFHYFENIVESTPVFQKFLSYNMAIIKLD
ncbi:MAG: methyltransferase domain-containing protein [Actinobacteria bacterium]|nr:methyltransferase domain-containing protein [Actinomycetota bacterium]